MDAQCSHSCNLSNRYFTFSKTIIPVVSQARIFIQSGLTNSPILVVLSLQLSFAVIPLVMFTSNRAKMGEFVSPLWIKILAWLTTGIIVLLNVKYLFDKFQEWLH